MGVRYPQYIFRTGANSVEILDEGGTRLALFSYAGTITTLEGTATTGDDFILKANSTNAYPTVYLFGNGKISFNTATNVQLNQSTTRMFQWDYASNVSTQSGGSVSGDDSKYIANNSDTYPYVLLYGNAGADLCVNTATNFTLKEATNTRLVMDGSTDNITINSSAVSQHYDLCLGGDGVLCLLETTTPTADTNYGKLYTKNDNHLYFQDGAGNEKQLAEA